MQAARSITTLLLAGWLFSPALAAEAARQQDPFDVEIEQIAPGIHLATRPVSTRQPVVGNGTVIINDDHVVVVDGNGSPLFAERLIAGIRALTDRPVRYLIVTHWHGDHNLGNHRYLEAWPGLEIIGHRFTRAAMLGAPMGYVAEYQATMAEQLDTVAEWVATGKGPEGEPLEPFQKRELGDLAQYRDVIVADLLASRVTPPTLTFERELVLRGGGRTIELRHAANGNTAGDVFVWLPAERVLVTGDLVVRPTPYGFYSYPRSWAGVLAELQSLDAWLIVPGHGTVMREPDYLARLQALLTDVAGQAERAVAAGQDLETFRSGFDIDAHRSGFTGDDPWLDSRWRVWFVQPIAEAAYNEAAGLENERLTKPSGG